MWITATDGQRLIIHCVLWIFKYSFKSKEKPTWLELILFMINYETDPYIIKRWSTSSKIFQRTTKWTTVCIKNKRKNREKHGKEVPLFHITAIFGKGSITRVKVYNNFLNYRNSFAVTRNETITKYTKRWYPHCPKGIFFISAARQLYRLIAEATQKIAMMT